MYIVIGKCFATRCTIDGSPPFLKFERIFETMSENTKKIQAALDGVSQTNLVKQLPTVDDMS